MAVKLSRLVSNNPWWKSEDWENTDPDLKKVDNFLERKTINIPEGKLTVLRGIRRSGKTVYLKRMVSELLKKGVNRQNIVYISCDRFNRSEVSNIIMDILVKRGGGYLLLDEVTNLADWNLVLKEIMEQGEFTIVATGSNPVEIKNMTERLPGRGIEGNEYYFNPLSFREFVRALIKLEDRINDEFLLKAIKPLRKVETRFTPLAPNVDELFPYYEEVERLFYVYILTGGFPNAIQDYLKSGRVSEETYEMLLRMLLGTLSKEKKSEETARRIMQEISAIGTGRTDYISIARDTGMHHNTVHNYLELLEKSRITYTLYAWDIEKKMHALKKQKKIVFQSPIIPVSIPLHEWGGKWEDVQEYVDKHIEGLVEDVIASHLIWTEERPVVREQHSFAGFFYERHECDFVFLKNGEFHGFESHYGKLKKAKYPFKTTYLTKDIMDEGVMPASLFLYGLEKGAGCL
ncbi:MAG: AAA family ATPase [Thermoplasmata archaeon]|nr:AAA family ATPase [Thermoplasmata archaeon]